MTTVVVNKNQLVGDRKILISKSAASRHFVDGPKIFRSADNTFAYASTGMLHSVDTRIEHELLMKTMLLQIEKGELTDHVKELVRKNILKDTLILTRKGFYHVYGGYPYCSSPETDWFVIGSGESMASTALVAGRTPREAVVFASKHDELTGSVVDTICATTLKAL